MSDLLPVSFDDMAEEVRRELRMRRAVYPDQVARRRLTQQRADRQIEVMEAVLATIEDLQRRKRERSK